MKAMRCTAAVWTLLIMITGSASAIGAVQKMNDKERLFQAQRVNIPFVENKGQISNADTRYYVDTFACRFSITRDGRFVYTYATAQGRSLSDKGIVEERLIGASINKISPEHRAVTRINYYPGKDKSKWIRHLPAFNRIGMTEIYPNIDLRLEAHGNNVEKLFHVHPQGNVSEIRLRIDRAEAMTVTPTGELKIETAKAALRLSAPVAYQIVNGKQVAVNVAYEVKGREYGFKVGKYDRLRKLVIDPLITSYLLGEKGTTNVAEAMAFDHEGNLYISGRSNNSFALFKFDHRIENLIDSAYFGTVFEYSSFGGKTDIAVDRHNNIFISGYIENADFPVTDNAFDTHIDNAFGSIREGFIAKFDAAQLNLQAATYIGGGGWESVNAIAIDDNDEIYAVGSVWEGSNYEDKFPVTATGYDSTYNKEYLWRVFIVKLDNNLERLLAATFLGSSDGDDRGSAIAVNSSGNVVVGGTAGSATFPTTQDCVDATFQGNSEAFVAVFDSNLQRLVASTYLGGLNDEHLEALVIDDDDTIYAAGWTTSSQFPTTQDSYDTSHNLAEDGFLAKIDQDLQLIRGATFIGGGSSDKISDIALTQDGAIAVIGQTESYDFPTTPDFHRDSFNGTGEDDGFLFIIDTALTACRKSTYIGGSDHDAPLSVLVNGDDILVGGRTTSDDYPFITNELLGVYHKLFVSRFNPDETPQPITDPGESPKLPGRFKSHNTILTGETMMYLDIDICSNGEFSGLFSAYPFCQYQPAMMMYYCKWEEADGGEPVTGKINFDENYGTMNLGGDCTDVPFAITGKSLESLSIFMDASDACDKLNGISSKMDFEGIVGDNCATTGPGNNSGTEITPGGDSDEGGGGCFVDSILY